MAIRLNNAICSAIVNSGIVGQFGTSGILKVYGGTQPTNGGDATTSALLVQISGIAWGAASNGTALITGTRTGTAGTSGSATWARLSGSDGTSCVIDGSCDIAANLPNYVIDNANITGAAVVTLTAATLIQPGS